LAVVVAGCELGSRSWRCWGAAPVDGCFADDFISSFVAGVYFDSISSLKATGPLWFMVLLGFFFGDDSRRRGGRLWTVRKDPRGIAVFFLF
jgi:hypothetical protein